MKILLTVLKHSVEELGMHELATRGKACSEKEAQRNKPQIKQTHASESDLSVTLGRSIGGAGGRVQAAKAT